MSGPVHSRTSYGPSCLGVSLQHREEVLTSLEESHTFCLGEKEWGVGFPDLNVSFMSHFLIQRAALASLQTCCSCSSHEFNAGNFMAGPTRMVKLG